MKIEAKAIKIIKEDAFASASNCGGMGAVSAPQASTLSGTTIGNNYSANGGSVGSGDISQTFNDSPFQKKKIPKKSISNKSKPKPPTKLKRFSEFTATKK